MGECFTIDEKIVLSTEKIYIVCVDHGIVYKNFIYLRGVEIMKKRSVSVEFSAVDSKLCKNCFHKISRNFHTRKLGETSVFHAVYVVKINIKSQKQFYFVILS